MDEELKEIMDAIKSNADWATELMHKVSCPHPESCSCSADELRETIHELNKRKSQVHRDMFLIRSVLLGLPKTERELLSNDIKLRLAKGL